jgi:hypothetical protein
MVPSKHIKCIVIIHNSLLSRYTVVKWDWALLAFISSAVVLANVNMTNFLNLILKSNLEKNLNVAAVTSSEAKRA